MQLIVIAFYPWSPWSSELRDLAMAVAARTESLNKNWSDIQQEDWRYELYYALTWRLDWLCHFPAIRETVKRKFRNITLQIALSYRVLHAKKLCSMNFKKLVFKNLSKTMGVCISINDLH
jgi:hypothetical protein